MSDYQPSDPDRITETSSQNVFQSIAGSFVAAAFGVLFFCIAIGLIVWNESRSVDAIRGLGQAAQDYVEAAPTPVDAAQERRLVHLTGQLEAHGAVSDPVFGLTKTGIVRLKRNVEMYQWKQDKHEETSSSLGGGQTTRTTYSYSKVWSSDPIDSGGFRYQSGHANPEMPAQSETFDDTDVTIGARRLGVALLQAMEDFKPIPPPDSAPGGYTRQGNRLYKGVDPDRPAIGDVRVGFFDVPAQQASILAEQRGTSLAPFRTKHGYYVGLVSAGDVTADEMIAQKRSEEKTLTWILRGVGFLLFFFALLLLAAPLNALADVIPFVGTIVGAGIFAFALIMAIPLTLATIALAWIAVRPLLGISLLAAAAVIVVAFVRLRPRRTHFLPPRR